MSASFRPGSALPLDGEGSVAGGRLLAHGHRSVVVGGGADVPVWEESGHQSADVHRHVPFVEQEAPHVALYADLREARFVLHFLEINNKKDQSESLSL